MKSLAAFAAGEVSSGGRARSPGAPRALGLIVIVVLTTFLAACGGGSSATGPAASTEITVHALDSLKFDSAAYTTRTGDITFGYVDDGAIVHTLRIKEKPDFELVVSSRGQHTTGTVTLSAGTYILYCDVPGHESAGMKATLTVT